MPNRAPEVGAAKRGGEKAAPPFAKKTGPPLAANGISPWNPTGDGVNWRPVAAY